jgi:HNH endonuclease
MPRTCISTSLRRIVIERARERCEYCLIHQEDTPDTHQIDHIIAIKHGGETVSENLAYACAECNHYKGTDFGTIDPATGETVRLFNPRIQQWSEHFELRSAQLIGLTRIGELTIELLRLNDEARIFEREVLMVDGRYPRV